MYIKSLKISNTKETIREITFRKGANLIVDETPIKDLKLTGNNVGKTTILRLIDYCLGGEGENIYKDPEFKDKGRSKIEDFLKGEHVLITLVLVNNFEDEKPESIIIERNFLEEGGKICKINGESFDDLKKEFLPELKELIFNSKNKKPSFRQIISKNIRDEKNRMNNAVRTLHSTTTSEEYESVYLFWLGIEIDSLSEKQELERKRSIEKSLQSHLKKEGSFSEISQSLIVVEKEIKDLEKKKSIFSENKDYEKNLTRLNIIKSNLNRFSTQLIQLETRKDLILESKEALEKEKSNIDSDSISHMYLEAKALIPNIQKSFTETLNFHNQMISRKIDYVTEELPKLERTISKLKKDMSIALLEEKELSNIIKQIETLEQLEELAIRLNLLYEKKGRLEEQKESWERIKKELEEIESRLEEINNEILAKQDIIESRIATFNEYFSALSDRLYGEKFILSSDRNKGGYELNISSFEGNLGTGKKKGLIIAFDFAYLQFANALKIKCPHFLLHDQIETIHNNQIKTVLNEMAGEIDGQYIVPVLKDKLPHDIDIDKLKIISLTPSDKLFKIP